ncbi:BA75_01558T0 [Komagataella pastoris]|uniref:Dolichol-phosphate mannosyltransferase subunit 1 n=1 Tax=Komagataella pastoris TaxID=4922 RepID=A0A1B2J6I8_PICPA|nr:BA75_01558T0 [Komagataella pastoris]
MAINNSIIVPAYKEKNNIRPLVTRIFAGLGNEFSKDTEVIIVDDNSKDGSVEEVDALVKEGYNVRIVVRTTERGLSSAVIRGFQEAKGERLVCMDADLQHPPESVPDVLNALKEASFALGTRYAPGVEIDKEWGAFRRFTSWFARLLALPLTPASDPMSGFFGLQKTVFASINTNDLDVQGFKIALELLVKAKLPHGIKDVPFSFGLREEGESKLSNKVIVQYLLQLKELYIYKFGVGTLAAVALLLVLVVLFLFQYLVL